MMLAYHRDEWKELDDLAEPTVGRSLPVGGFILGDPFDVFLRNISEDYLRAAWERLSSVLEQNWVVTADLSWGWMHPGETGLADDGREPSWNSTPSDFIGWTSHDLSEIWRSEEMVRLDEELKRGKPPLRCTATWRSLKWRIAPDDFQLALRLVEALCVEEVSDWHPNVVLAGAVNPAELWRKVATAIRDDDQQSLDLLIEEARRAYTPLGFHILVLGYTGYLQGGGYAGIIRLPRLA